MATRIYVVSVEDERGSKHLVRAASAAQAIRHIAFPMFRASVANQDELVELASKGMKVREANDD